MAMHQGLIERYRQRLPLKDDTAVVILLEGSAPFDPVVRIRAEALD